MLSRLARWWLRRAEPVRPEDDPLEPEYWNPTGQCVCGKHVSGPDWHIVVAIMDDDEDIGATYGQTAMSADFCSEHCPGGCRLGCVSVEG